MNQKEIRELIEFLKEQDISEFELERGDVKIRVKRGVSAPQLIVPAMVPQISTSAPHAAAPPTPTAPATAAPAAEPVADDTANAHIVKSPIVGTFYECPSPGAPPFVKLGDSVSVGQVLCIVEAMKLMNEIESDVSGTIVKRFVENGQPVEYGQQLFAVKP
jgi:acetyl-CoA carboxylase biotin carboxyl carrier protein